MVITSTQIYRVSSQRFLEDLGYQVVGPFDHVNSALDTLIKTKPDIIIFDTFTTEPEIIQFDDMMLNTAKGIPLLLLVDDDQIHVDYHPVEFLIPPLQPVIFEQKITQLLNKRFIPKISMEQKTISFINHFLQQMIKLVPSNLQQEIEHHIHNLVIELTGQNPDIYLLTKGSSELKLTDPETLKVDLLIDQLYNSIQQLITVLNDYHGSNWTQPLIQDAIETTVMGTEDIPDPIVDLIGQFGLDYSSIRKSLEAAIPSVEAVDKTVFVAKIVLSDIGPELKDIVSDNPELIAEFDPSVASQLITIVGQGSSYHQGIFGPLPIPHTNNIVVIMQSKLLDSDIMDRRMEGRTLVVVAIGIHRELINMIPKREKLIEVFSPLDDISHERQITTRLLQRIEDNYEMAIEN
jgi:hypothetical protein